MRLFSLLVLVLFSPVAGAQLAGKVTSTEEGAMEGVLVSAKKAGSTITVTVVSDREGRYRFPEKKLSPGKYALSVRAAGYVLDESQSVQLGHQPLARDLSLRKTDDLAAQLSNGEWMASAPGTDQQKGQLLNCVGCHSLERVVRSRFDADTFTKTVLPRMQGYDNQSVQLGHQPLARDLSLRKTDDLAAQLSNGEWMASAPGTDQQKGQLLNCVGCHSLERVVRSRFDADTFTKTVLPRMQGYVN